MTAGGREFWGLAKTALILKIHRPGLQAPAKGRALDATPLPDPPAFEQPPVHRRQQCPGAVRFGHGISYLVEGDAISGTYQGGRIRLGTQVGRVTGPDTIELLFQCLTLEGELLSGWSRGTVGIDHAGLTTLAFEWGWLSGAMGGGESGYVECVSR